MLRVEILFAHALIQNVQAFLPLAAANNLAHARHEHVHGPHGLPVIVEAHVKRLQRPRVVVQDDRTLEMLLGQILFVLGLQVVAPSNRELPTLARLEEYIDRFGVRDAKELLI